MNDTSLQLSLLSVETDSQISRADFSPKFKAFNLFLCFYLTLLCCCTGEGIEMMICWDLRLLINKLESVKCLDDVYFLMQDFSLKTTLLNQNTRLQFIGLHGDVVVSLSPHSKEALV